MNTADKVGVIMLCILLLAMVGTIGGAIYIEQQKLELKRQVVIEVTRQYREIPKCDKPTWDRIIDGCGEE